MTAGEPFSRPVRVDALPRDGLNQTIVASEAERAALARLNNAPDIAELTATFTLKRAGRGAVRVTGQLHAALTRVCVVSLEPFAVTVDETIDLRFAPPREPPPSRRAAPEETVDVSLDGEDEPDPIIDGKIDLGAVAAEFLALALDPYPRKPGVAFTPPSEAEDEPDSPFAALADKDRKD